jgi:hypothetical protein
MTNHPEYRLDKFDSDIHHIEYLLALYEKPTAPLLAISKSKRTWQNKP